MTDDIQRFIARWQKSGAAERANYQLFLSELCDVLDAPRPDPATPDEAANAYVFEKSVPLPHGATGRIDLYRRGCFVLEAKQGGEAQAGAGLPTEPPLSAAGEARARSRKKGVAPRGTAAWDTAMERARQQAQSYARNLPTEELKDGGRPPFLIVVDVGESLALYSEFTRTGGNYVPFPNPLAARISLADLHQPETRELLRTVWLDPMSLDPGRRAARVTREIAARLARLAQALERGHDPDAVAHFLMRCLFTMFAEDVALLPAGSFTQLLADARRNVAHFPRFVEELWSTMAHGGFSLALRLPIPHFNGGLFEDAAGLPLTEDQLQLLIEAAQADWRDVEPAIFGALLERALDPVERHKLGAHFTPRAYVERLVTPTVVEPLRAEWEAVQAAALRLVEDGKPDKALGEVEAFQRRLAAVRILDPACGTGNFLYVSLEHLLRLEAEVLEVRRQLGADQMLLELEAVRVTPRQLLGIEVNPRAAAIAELVLWIGYLRWRLQTAGDVGHLPEPILANYHNIERRDAVLAWDAIEPLLDAAGRPVTRWDGRTTVTHPVTGEQVPDEAARIPAYRYINPRPAEWPDAEFVVGNPPFIGGWRIRQAQGDGYVEGLWSAYPQIPQKADYVMYWWDRAAAKAREKQIRRFGFITTNSITQVFQRRVLRYHLEASNPLQLVMAIPDHPWVDTESAAAVRIAMTVGQASQSNEVHLGKVIAEQTDGAVSVEFSLASKINSDLTAGVDLDQARGLRANAGLCSPGVQLYGSGFIVDHDEAIRLTGLARSSRARQVIRKYINGSDLVGRSRNAFVIDFFGCSQQEASTLHPDAYQRVLDRVKPERDQNRRRSIRETWWRFGWERPLWRQTSAGLNRFISTPETSKHRVFVFLAGDILPDNRLTNFALEDAFFLGILASRIHVTWALANGGTLEDRPIYTKSRCFDPFPFPDATDAQRARIRGLAEELDGHRKRQQAQHPKLTLTDMYNVLEKLRAGEALSKAEKVTHEQGLVSVLRQLHDDLDAAVFDAYGWPTTLSDEEILARLVALNAERAAEEARGLVRWLRPEYQAPADRTSRFTTAPFEEEAPGAEAPPAARPLLPWPDGLAEQAAAVRAALVALGRPVTPEEVAAAFDAAGTGAAPAGRVSEWLAALAALGQARAGEDGRYATA